MLLPEQASLLIQTNRIEGRVQTQALGVGYFRVAFRINGVAMGVIEGSHHLSSTRTVFSIDDWFAPYAKRYRTPDL